MRPVRLHDLIERTLDCISSVSISSERCISEGEEEQQQVDIAAGNFLARNDPLFISKGTVSSRQRATAQPPTNRPNRVLSGEARTGQAFTVNKRKARYLHV